jgi:hypothetical protein
MRGAVALSSNARGRIPRWPCRARLRITGAIGSPQWNKRYGSRGFPSDCTQRASRDGAAGMADALT